MSLRARFDSATGKQVFDTLKKLSETKLVIVVSHDREFAEQYADRIIELSDGQVISDVELDGEAEHAETPELALSFAAIRRGARWLPPNRGRQSRHKRLYR